MEILREFEVTYSFKDIYKNQRKLTFSIDRIFLSAITAVLFGVMEFLLILSTSDSTRDLTVVLIISFLVAILTFFIGLPAISYALAIYSYKVIRSNSLNPQTIQMTNEGLVLLGKTTQMLLSWKTFNNIQRKNGLIELCKDKKLVLMFPSSGFKGDGEEKTFFEICKTQIQAAINSENDQKSLPAEPLER
jgi:hypothetical protein